MVPCLQDFKMEMDSDSVPVHFVPGMKYLDTMRDKKGLFWLSLAGNLRCVLSFTRPQLLYLKPNQ